MGLSGAGKTYLAERLQKHLDCDWHNADKLREKYNDWDFSREGRIRQAYRMEEYAEKSETKYVICDFICALEEMRNILMTETVNYFNIVKSIFISIIYFIFGIVIFYISYFGAKKRGTLINMGE